MEQSACLLVSSSSSCSYPHPHPDAQRLDLPLVHSVKHRVLKDLPALSPGALKMGPPVVLPKTVSKSNYETHICRLLSNFGKSLNLSNPLSSNQ